MSLNAENLTISIPGNSCNKNCPYCISKITNDVEFNDVMWFKNLLKLKVMAKSSGVHSILLTGKGEPTLNLDHIYHVCSMFSEFPLELQTNGIIFRKNPEVLSRLVNCSLTTIAISMDFIDSTLEENLEELKEFFKLNKTYDLNIRLSINFTDHVPESYLKLNRYIDLCKRYNVKQLLFRNITNPVNIHSYNEATNWITRNNSGSKFKIFTENFSLDYLNGYSVNSPNVSYNLIRTTRFGMCIYDIDDISVSFSDYCIQESNNSIDIRSLIYQADGHLYTSWNSKASIIF